MTLSLLEDLALTKGLREALPFVTSLVEAAPELSARSIISTLRGQGLSFSDAGAFRLISQLKTNLDIAERFRANVDGGLPDVSTLIRSAAPLTRNYAFLVSVTGYNPITAERETRHFQIISDELLSLADLRTTALNMPREGGGSGVLQNEVVDIISGTASRYAPL